MMQNLIKIESQKPTHQEQKYNQEDFFDNLEDRTKDRESKKYYQNRTVAKETFGFVPKQKKRRPNYYKRKYNHQKRTHRKPNRPKAPQYIYVKQEEN